MAAELENMREALGRALPEVQMMGLMMYDPIWGESEHTTPSMEILHVVSGHLDLVLGGEKFSADPGDTLLVPSGEPHMDVFDIETGLEVFYCSAVWSWEEELWQRVSNRDLLAMPQHVKAELVAMFDHLRVGLNSADPVDELLARARLLAVLLFILKVGVSGQSGHETRHVGADRRREIMLLAKRYLQEHYASHISLADVASALKVSGYYLSHVFSQESGFSLSDYLTSLRMTRARELLCDGTKSVAEIAYAVGYGSPNYFGKAFRKYAGCTPKEFALSARR